MKVLAIQRAPQFSPNSVEKDRAILMAVVDCLCAKGCEVTVACETELFSLHFPPSTFHLILSMGRLPETLQWLDNARTIHNSQIDIVNSPESVAICSNRSHLVSEMKRLGIPLPPEQGTEGYWLKRGDACAQSEGDVVFAAGEEEKAAQIEAFARRGIRDVVVQAHVGGDLVKFYGVQGTGFFRHFYPTDDGQTKFDDEQHNGRASHFPFSLESLQTESERLASAICLSVYGGDAIVRADGSFCIIDFNDWPSFSRCRQEAAEAIASLVEKAC